MNGPSRLAIAVTISSLAATQASALCVGDGCSIMGAHMLTVCMCWPIYLVILLSGLLSSRKAIPNAGVALGLLGTVWAYQNTVNLGRSDLIWIPSSHMIFAVLIFLAVSWKERSLGSQLESSTEK